ncbi:hypothetical protein HY086_04945 [Candidatus Gottesmanbacteria bacterium]|nr:hypothetical protein [Candidatus Gottesmanbacteria bacterium]
MGWFPGEQAKTAQKRAELAVFAQGGPAIPGVGNSHSIGAEVTRVINLRNDTLFEVVDFQGDTHLVSAFDVQPASGLHNVQSRVKIARKNGATNA